MAQTVTCPYCWHAFRADQLLLRCSDICPAPERTSFPVKESVKGNCPHGRHPLPRRFCPDQSCRRPLPREYLDIQGRNVAVIGSADAGKTTYVGVLLHELKGRVSGQFNGMSLDLLGDESRENYRDRFAGRLFQEGLTVRKTPGLTIGSKLEPIIFTLKILTQGRFRTSVQSILSVFYDASGENVMSAQAMDPLARYLESASAVLVLVDPMQMPELRREYGGALPTATRETAGTDQREVIQRLGELLRESTAKRQVRLKVPLAIALTKVDLLRESFDPESPLRRLPNHDGYYDEPDGADVHEELRAWLDRWYGPEFDNTVRANFADYRYFGLSALGAPPRDDTHLASSGVHPYRVEDPMLWLLAQFGSIKRRKAKR